MAAEQTHSTSGGLDLGEKYKRLACDYAKIKSQLSVLKAKFLEEQDVKKSLEDRVREKDLDLRKASRENEALGFRNTQLSRRVLALQEDINSGKRKDKERLKSPTDTVTQGALEAQASELAKKLKENEELIRTVNDLKVSSEGAIRDLRAQLEQKERASSRAEEILSNIEQQHQQQVKELQTLNAVLQGKYDKMAAEVNVLKENQKRPFDGISTSSAVVGHLDPSNGPLVSGMTAPQEPGQPSLLEGLKGVSSQVGQFCSHLTNYHSYLEQRLFQHADIQEVEFLSPRNKKFLELLKQSKSKTRPIESVLTNFVEKLSEEFSQQDLEEFVMAWSELTIFVERLTPFHQMSLEEESSLPSCGQKLSDRNRFLSSVVPLLPGALGSLGDYIHLLIQNAAHPNEGALCMRLCKLVQVLHSSLKGLMAAFSAKVTLEYQMPTISAKLKTTNECILSSLNGLCGVMDQVNAFMSAQGSALLLVRTAVKTKPQPVEDSKTSQAIMNGGEEVLISLATSSEALAEVNQMKEALERNLEEAQKRVVTLEEEKETLLVEFQLVKMKLEREQKSGISRPGSGRNQEADSTSLQGEDGAVSEGELVQKHFAGRVAELSSQVQQSDSKVTFLVAECQALQKQLVSSLNSKARLELDLEESSITISKLEDEIKTLSSNYETQLSVMSDHLCSLNEQLMNKSEAPQAQRTTKQKKKRN